jgi:ornithine cyclodeaminase/alanine dehydrogenase
MPLLLTRRDVQAVLTMRDTIDAVENGFRQLSAGKVEMPQRTVIRVASHKGLHLAMPAHADTEDGQGVLAVKVVTVYPDNPTKHDLPTILGTLLLNDAQTGKLAAIMDAGFLTGMRTGAASGVATKYLAREDARTLGIFGAGGQARTQLMAVHEVRPLERVQVFDPQKPVRDTFVREMSASLGIEVTPVEDARACVENDIVCAASSSKTPIFDGSWLQPGTHVNGVGSHSPDARELDTETIRRSKIIADYTPACMVEAGDFLFPIKEGAFSQEQIHADLGEVASGTKPGRESDDEITLFKSVGLAIQDAMTAACVYDLARKANVGTQIEI